MPGFNFMLNFKYDNLINLEDDLINDSFFGDNFSVNRFTNDKFLNDKLFLENEKYIIVLEGVILNKNQLLKQSNANDWAKYVLELYQERGNDFFKYFNGSFSGIFHDKKKNKWIAFTDQLGTKPLYYFIHNDELIVSSDISNLYNILKRNNTSLSLNVQAAYMLLSYGYMLENHTLSMEVKKIEPGTFLLSEKNNIEFQTYYRLPLSSMTTSLNDDELIDELDKKFRRAVQLQFEKDKEYGYSHLVGLSGGLDSRMTCWVAKDLGYNDQLNYTFSQSDYLDETIPKKIASDLKNDWIFKSLDNGNFLKDIDEVTRITGGNVLYYGLAHGLSFYKLFNFNKHGLVHTGQLGDIVISSFIKSLDYEKSKQNLGAYSTKFLKFLNSPKEANSIQELENLLIYKRGLNGANIGLLGAQVYSETMSPFYEIEFFEFCLSIPITSRLNHRLYKKWILQKYPKAAEYIWESSNKKINYNPLTINYKGGELDIKNIPKLFLNKFGISTNNKSLSSKHHMNPLNYWYTTNKDIREFQDNYYNLNIDKLLNKELKLNCIKLYNDGDALEKNQVLSLLAAVKLYF